MVDRFRAMVIEDRDGKPVAGFRELTLADLPDHDVLVEVHYSTLNYKDGLAIAGKGRIARRLPMVGGVDLAGIVIESRSADWKPGDKVVVNGWGLSETEWGGYSRFQRLKPEWLTRLPDAFTLEESMAIGTAGYTAALAVRALEDWGMITGDRREVLVTGAAGGVGSVAITLLAARGHTVTASTGRPETHNYLAELGATGFIDRGTLSEKGRRAAEGALGRCDRFRRLHDACQCAGADHLRRSGCCLRPCRRRRSTGNGDAAYPARRRTHRYRFRYGTTCKAPESLGVAGREP